jgi:Predicted transcriptional regulator
LEPAEDEAAVSASPLLALDAERCAEIALIMKALGHPVRLRIVALLDRGPLHVGALAEQLGVGQAVVSQQLGILRMRGLVASRRDQGRAVYRLTEPKLRDLLRCMEGCRVR